MRQEEEPKRGRRRRSRPAKPLRLLPPALLQLSHEPSPPTHAVLAPSPEPQPAGMIAANGRSGSAAPEPPPPPAPEEGDGWVLLPSSEVEGVEDPKVIHWEDLQQELARLWSLSAALQAARDRKAHLAASLESALQARRAFLQQDNELAELRQGLQDHTDHLGDLKVCTKKSADDIEDRRERLCVNIRTLSVASKTLGAARNNLEEANKLLSGENGRGRLKNMEQKLWMRQQYMITQVAQIYPVRPLDEQSPGQKHSFTPSVIKISNAESILPNGYQKRPLAILGLQLLKPTTKKTGYFSDKTDFQKSSTVLGYAAHAVSLIASYLNVPLRYLLRFGGSRSYVLDPSPSVEPSSIMSVATSIPPSTSMRILEFPLYFDGQETTKSAYAIFLLNKDIEQLLNYIGAESLGPRHVLANLRQLTTIIQSQQYISVD